MLSELLESNGDFSLGKIVLLFNLLICSGALFPLLSKQMKKKLENERLAQHILGIFTILTLVILVSNSKYSIQRIFAYTFITYLWFIFSTKMDIHFTIITIIGLVSFYLYQNNIKHDIAQIDSDINLSDNNKNEIKMNKNQNYIYITGILISITILGTYLYSNKKEGQYGGGYSLINYLIY